MRVKSRHEHTLPPSGIESEINEQESDAICLFNAGGRERVNGKL